MKGIIYTATNTNNGKVYVGQTAQPLQKRMYQHKYEVETSKKNLHFHHSIRKYGWSTFVWDIVAETNDSELLNCLEEFYINLYDSTNNERGYNTLSGGNYFRGENHPAYGIKHSDERRQQMSEQKKELYKNPENNPFYGKRHTKESRELVSKAKKGKKRPEITGDKNPSWKGFNTNKMIALFSRGLNRKRISEIMGCSQQTVKRHLIGNGVVL